MSKRTKPAASRQDARPFAHATGRWTKKCCGAFVYLGKVADDPTGEAAWLKWLEIRDDVRAGRKPRPKCDTLTVETLANLFLDAKKARIANGELTQRTWADYQQLLHIVVEILGRNRAAADIQPDDWAKLRAVFAKRWGPWRLANAVVYTKGVWKWGWENGQLAAPMRFGSGFGRPTAKTMRASRNATGPRMFEPEQIRAILAVATPNVKALTLLGINGALGNTDLALLPLDAIDMVGGWLNYPRHKTAIGRRIPLWGETLQAIREVIASRPTPRAGCESMLFIRENGNAYIGYQSGHAVGQEFTAAAAAAGVEGRTFYDLRRSFQTIGERAKDPVGVSAVMGHVASGNDMSATYRQRIDDDRLLAVVGVVHDWLYGTPGDGTDDEGDRHQEVNGSTVDTLTFQGHQEANGITVNPLGSEKPAKAAGDSPIQRAIVRCLRAIETAEGPDKAALAAAWNSSEIALALSGESWTVEKFLQVWGGPQLRVVSAG